MLKRKTYELENATDKLTILADHLINEDHIVASNTACEKSIVARYIHNQTPEYTQTFATIKRALQRACSATGYTPVLSEGIARRTCIAFKLVEEDYGWFFTGNIDQFNQALKTHNLKARQNPSSISESRRLSGGKVLRQLAADIASMNAGPLSENAPLEIGLELSTDLVRIIEEQLVFGFSRLLIDLSFEENSEAQLVNCLGTEIDPYEFQNGIQIRLVRDGRAPQFEVVNSDKTTPLNFYHQFDQPIGKIKRIKIGEKFLIRLRAERRDGLIAFADEDSAPDDIRQKVITAMIKKTLYQAGRNIKFHTIQDGQYILICSQEYEVVKSGVV